jgi:hypothetical protein
MSLIDSYLDKYKNGEGIFNTDGVWYTGLNILSYFRQAERIIELYIKQEAGK